MIELANVSKTYNYKKSNEFMAVRDISLVINEEEFVAIVGKSGAGKSTLLHILGGIEQFESGSYCLDGVRIEKKSDRELAKIRCEKIGFVLQDFGLLSEETALQNVCMPLYFDKTPRREIKKKAREALSKVGMESLEKKKVSQLSGGQKQRVAIARAIVKNPSVILADEPTGALDSKTSAEIFGLFQELNKGGKTIIIVTHEKSIAEMCKRTITISDGQIISDEKNGK